MSLPSLSRRLHHQQADILMVTDGEIPSPSKEILSLLATAHDQLGLEVHGLLVGRSVTPPMEALCHHLHVVGAGGGRERSDGVAVERFGHGVCV
jgi:uncharacterized protein with von Willebrand factor type A (vWA) domain